MSNYFPTIGLEIHAELKTRTKMFCDSLNDPDEKKPNVHICPICMGHPGTLPVPNAQAIKKIVQVGIALNCKIAEFSKFDRKHYFYPDLPKGYQISQYDKPFASSGELEIRNPKSEIRKIKITRIHLEEDAGRLVHHKGADYSLVDYNRAGIPLMELVTEPDMHSAEEARRFAEEFQLILRYLGASDAGMEKGQMRVEVNISLAKNSPAGGVKKLGTKVEIKNLNSFRVIEKTVAYEIKRQSELLDNGEQIVQETRGWDEAKQQTFSQRVKEEAHDYRYFPEPDIPPIRLSGALKLPTEESGFSLEAIRASLPELPGQKRERFLKEFGINEKLAEIFVRDTKLADYYEGVISELLLWEEAEGHSKEQEETRQKLIVLCTNYITTDLRKIMLDESISIEDLKISPENFAEFVILIHTGKISSRGAKDLLPQMLKTGGDPSNLIEERGLAQVSDESGLEPLIDKVIKANPEAVSSYKGGKENILKFLVGQVMKETKGSANPQVAAELLKKKLK